MRLAEPQLSTLHNADADSIFLTDHINTLGLISGSKIWNVANHVRRPLVGSERSCKLESHLNAVVNRMTPARQPNVEN